VRVYKQFDEGMADFSGEFSADELKAFIRLHGTPLIDEIGPENFMKYVETGLPIAYIFLADDDTRKSVPEMLKSVAKEFKNNVAMVWIDADKYAGHAETLNLESKWPAFAIQEPASQTKFPFPQDQEITEEAIRKFVSDYAEGKLEPSVKSDPIPEKNDEPVKVVVADEFEKIVMDAERDVLIEFYAPWCGHCKSLAPTYDLVGAKYAAQYSDKITIAKMDATTNDVPPSSGMSVTGFPTIKLVKAGTNEVVDYTGDRSEDSFYKFVKENGTYQIDVGTTGDATDEDPTEEEAAEEILLEDEAEEKTDKRDEL
jgi:protein disulfide-isomerase A1